jgi:hypothetical protein
MQFRKSLYLVFLAALSFLASCNSEPSFWNAEESKRIGRALSIADDWYVYMSSADPARSSSRGEILETTGTSLDCGCNNGRASVIIQFRRGNTERGGPSVCIDNTNPQLVRYIRLSRGDRVSFEYVDTPVQRSCGTGAFVRIKE